jgi:hypothetical protein
MRFAAAATLAVFLGFQAPAWGQETPVQRAPAEPPLESVITHFFPGYAPMPLSDLAPEIGALTVSEPAYNNPDLVILMSHGDGRFAKAIESFFGGVAHDIYLGYLPAGTVLPAPSDTVENAPPLTLENPAVTLNILGQISDAFYWDSLSSRFQNAPAPR